MTVGFQIGSSQEDIGASNLMHAFFSTIASHLEPQGWGSRYPELMNELYRGKLDQKHAAKALDDIAEIRAHFRSLTPTDVVWDIERP